jgi:hypothetical protein
MTRKEELKELGEIGFCLRCLDKFHSNDGELALNEMCGVCSQKMLFTILDNQKDQ